MVIQGKIVQILPIQTGEGRNGTWKKNRFVIETQGQYPKKVMCQVWGDKIDSMAVEQGLEVVVSINVESREYNGNWYTDVSAWKVVPQQGTIPSQNQPIQQQSASPMDTSSVPPGREPDIAQDYVDDLPF